jgi:hypothetical protein
VNIISGGTTISTASLLTEEDVNARVATYANGTKAGRLAVNTGVSKWLNPDYISGSNALAGESINAANASFKEGNYWGLYLYQTGH